MKPTTVAMLMPPVAVLQYGHANTTAAPIAVFWLFGLLSVCYGMLGGILGGWIELLLGAALWIISGVWARLVIQGVQYDVERREDSTLAQTVEPSLEEEADPLEKTRPH